VGFVVRAKWRVRGVQIVSDSLVRLWRLHGRFRTGYIIAVVTYVKNKYAESIWSRICKLV